MPTFRFHRGSLEDSMKTCIYVKNKQELFESINNFNACTGKSVTDKDKIYIGCSVNADRITIRPYCFDKRIGWNTHIVLGETGCVTRDPFIIGFLSDNLEN